MKQELVGNGSVKCPNRVPRIRLLRYSLHPGNCPHQARGGKIFGGGVFLGGRMGVWVGVGMRGWGVFCPIHFFSPAIQRAFES